MRQLSIITPTGDRFETLRLLGRFLLAQTYPGIIQWIVVDDGETNASARALAEIGDSALANKGIFLTHYKRPFRPQDQGPKSLGFNLLAGLGLVSGDAVLICEDDDCYLPGHVQDLAKRLERADAAGTKWQHYYHLPSMSFRTFLNRGSALCSTGLRVNLIPTLAESARACIQSGSKGIDAHFWAAAEKARAVLDIYDPLEHTIIGMKGLPGRGGIGVGHRPKGFIRDLRAEVLMEWTKQYADTYLTIRKEQLL